MSSCLGLPTLRLVSDPPPSHSSGRPVAVALSVSLAGSSRAPSATEGHICPPLALVSLGFPWEPCSEGPPALQPLSSGRARAQSPQGP